MLSGDNAISKNREIMGATNPADADPGTIRADFADSIEENIVHGSDGPDTAALERTFRALDAVTDQPKAIVADTLKGRGVSFMEGPAALSASKLYLFHSGAPPEQQYIDGLAELLASAERHFAALGLGALHTEARVRNARREPRSTDNLVAAYGREDVLIQVASQLEVAAPWAARTPA